MSSIDWHPFVPSLHLKMATNDKLGSTLKNVFQKQNCSNPHRSPIKSFADALEGTMKELCPELKENFICQEISRFKDGEKFSYKLWIIMNGNFPEPKDHKDGLPLVRLYNDPSGTTPSFVIRSWCNNENEITICKVHDWLKSMVQKSLEKVPDSKKPAEVTPSENSHSIILKLNFPDGKTAKIFLMLALKKPKAHGTTKKASIPPDTTELYYCASDYCLEGDKKAWCLHPIKNEDSVLSNKSIAPTIFKTIKKIGEINRFSLRDYTYLAQFSKLKLKDSEWQDISLGCTFVKYVNKLKDSFNSGNLAHPLYPNYNLLKAINGRTRDDIAQSLDSLVVNCNRNPCWIEEFLMGSPSTSPYPPLADLKDIQARIRIDENERARNMQVLQAILKIIIAGAKEEDSIFTNLFNRIEYTGSYYENLKVGAADEFDLDFVFNFPLDKYELKNHSDPQLIVYKKIYLKEPYEKSLSQKQCAQNVKEEFKKKFLDGENYLLRSGFTKWFESTIDKVRNKLNLSGGFAQAGINGAVHRHRSGPAYTLKINVPKSEGVSSATIDVDLVPVFEFPYKKPGPSGLRSNLSKIIDEENLKWMLVPKPIKKDPDDTLWRVHMCLAEKKMLEIRESPKPIIRLIKLLRDTQGWTCIASYFIKCLAMEWVEKKLNDVDYWKEKNMPVALFEMLQNLKECLRKKTLKSYCFPAYNLLADVASETLNNYACRLEAILPKIAKEPISLFIKG